jgi:hypothetical protein
MRRAVIITQQGPPHDAFIGCSLDRGTRRSGDPCSYTNASRGLEDDCDLGLICDHRGACRFPCTDSLQCGLDESCESFENLAADLSPYGLCQPCGTGDDDDRLCLDPGGP